MDEVDAAYDSDEVLAFCVHGCMECFGLQPAAFSFSQIVPLVLFQMDGDKRVSSVLSSLEFPSSGDSDEPGELLDPSVDPDLYGLAVNWIEAGCTVTEILEAAGKPRLAYGDLQQLTATRARLLAEAAKAAQEEAKKPKTPLDKMPESKKSDLVSLLKGDIEKQRLWKDSTAREITGELSDVQKQALGITT